MASIEGVNFVVFYHPSASEIFGWSGLIRGMDSLGGQFSSILLSRWTWNIWLEWSYKRGTIILHRWCNGWHACLECCWLWVRTLIGLTIKDSEIGISCFSAALRRKSKDWLARYHNNVSEWGDISIWVLLFQWESTIKKNPTKRVGDCLIQSRPHQHHLIEN